ncbi:class I SAM-dependent methyltransferase [Pseudomonas sp. M47T1]|uniref:class I SAM-dependent methyltransferase n=1 Tax=Pseudomonas sp. M47T1 TaxID=1179778 RepID=UPI0009D9CE2C|nr:class I SAM-dependent methyltransferase [Pseudomonas sp. M47T1]
MPRTAEQDARSVLGLEVSQRMLERARTTTRDPRITDTQADLEHLALPECSTDLVYSSLTLHYLKNLPGLLTAAYKALVPGGHLVFSIEHPIFMASKQADWLTAPDGRKVWPMRWNGRCCYWWRRIGNFGINICSPFFRTSQALTG